MKRGNLTVKKGGLPMSLEIGFTSEPIAIEMLRKLVLKINNQISKYFGNIRNEEIKKEDVFYIISTLQIPKTSNIFRIRYEIDTLGDCPYVNIDIRSNEGKSNEIQKC